ncbi:MAG: AAA family ATPase, partial [Kofleriaceae bacterium]
MAPLTWDRHTPSPPQRVKTPDPDMDGLDTTQFDAVEPGMDFGESEGERTVITTASYDLKPKFMGRTGAIKQLQDVVAKAFAPNGTLGFAVIVGEPGMGKSRIISELISRAKQQHPGMTVLAGIADENSHAYGPIARALTSRFGVVVGENPDESRDKIQAGVAEIVPAARVPEIAHLIAHLLRVPFDDSPVVGPLLDSSQRLEARLFMGLKRLLTAETDKHPVLIVVENLELCENDTINFLHYLAAGMTDRRVAIVGTATAALFERHRTFGDGEVAPIKIDLSALSPNEAEELLRELCKQLHEVPPRLLQHVRGMGGSPRAIQELVRLLLESDVITREGMMWRLDADKLSATTLPKTYDELVAARLEVMEPIERRVIEMAAVVGERSWLDAVIALERSGATAGQTDPDGPTLADIASSGDHSRLAVVAAVSKLIEREWLVEIPLSSVSGERELRFSYQNLWAIVYKAVDEPRRRGYHNVIARWLELHPEGRSPAQQEEVGRHLALAGETREAAVRYRRSAEAARAEYQNEKAIRLFDRALVCL